MNSEIPGKIAYREHFPINTLTTGQCIGLRTFLSKDIAVDGSIIEGADPDIEKANYTVIANSATVALYTLDKYHIAYVPRELLVIFGFLKEFRI